MTNNNNAVSGGAQLPKEFFTVSTFGTLGGAALVAWVVSGVLSGVFQIDPKVIGLIVSIAVAYVGLFLSKEKRKAQYVVTFFNGFLIYATVVGGTSLTPYINGGTARVVQEKRVSIRTALTRPWIPDRNLVAATKNLTEIANERTRALTEVNQHIKTTRDKLVATPVLSTQQRDSLLSGFSRSEGRIQQANSRVTPEIESLRRMGVELKRR